MKPLPVLAALLLAVVAALPALTDDAKKDDAFVPMFDGKTLKGWHNVNCAPDTFTVKDGEIITTGKPTGYLRTEKQYENFIAEFDWKHIPPKPGEVGNSGFFVWADPIPAVGTGYTRGIEVQVLVNLTYKNKKGEITATSQGDLFSIHGAHCTPDRPHPSGWERCLPSEDHCKGEGEWNHYRVEANDGRITLAVNGHEVSGVSKCNPRKGYLALESEGSECHFKNLKIKELPSTNPKKEEIADEATGFVNLYTGLDLSGWKVDDEAKKHWKPDDTVMHYDGKGKELRTDKEYSDAEYMVDVRFSKGKTEPCTLLLRGDKEVKVSLAPAGKLSWSIGSAGGSIDTVINAPGDWNRLRITAASDALRVTVNGKQVHASERTKLPAKGALVLGPEGEMDFANLFVRELK
jgi:3-keto-disaccharide hydrolase